MPRTYLRCSNNSFSTNSHEITYSYDYFLFKLEAYINIVLNYAAQLEPVTVDKHN